MSLKKVLITSVVVVFISFWLMTDPIGLGSATRGAGGQVWGFAKQLFGSVIDFITAL